MDFDWSTRCPTLDGMGATCSKTYSAGCGAPPLAWLATAGRVAGSPRPRRCTRTGGMRTTGDRQDHAGPGDGRTVAGADWHRNARGDCGAFGGRLLAPGTPLITTPPFVAPHHTSSVDALVGGGCGLAKPGTVSQAHDGGTVS